MKFPVGSYVHATIVPMDGSTDSVPFSGLALIIGTWEDTRIVQLVAHRQYRVWAVNILHLREVTQTEIESVTANLLAR